MINNSDTNVDDEAELFFKILCIGDSGTGKSHFLQTIKNRLNAKKKMKPLLGSISETVGIGFCSRVFSLEEKKKVKIHFWELSGQKRFNDIIETYFLNGNAVLYFCDADNPGSIDNIGEWKNKIVRYRTGYCEFLKCRNPKNSSYQNSITDIGLEVPEMIILNINDNTRKTKTNIEKYTSTLNSYRIPVVPYNGSLHSTYNVCDKIISILLDYYKEIDENEAYVNVGYHIETTGSTECNPKYMTPINETNSDISVPLLKHSFSVDSISSITSSNECSYPSHHRLTIVEDTRLETSNTFNDEEYSMCCFFNWCNLF
jgi:GTPase SAR1 family protein